jgi:diadenosine tetraphosphatase ApaH/serine/threonine PP2A family protein phosphatase
MTLVHASPGDYWRAPAPEATDEGLMSIYGPLESTVAIYGHIHRPYIRKLAGLTVANTGSAGLSYDGDRRAAYLLLDDGTPSIRRVDYDLSRELKALAGCGIPQGAWVAGMLQSARPQMP